MIDVIQTMLASATIVGYVTSAASILSYRRDKDSRRRPWIGIVAWLMACSFILLAAEAVSGLLVQTDRTWPEAVAVVLIAVALRNSGGDVAHLFRRKRRIIVCQNAH